MQDSVVSAKLAELDKYDFELIDKDDHHAIEMRGKFNDFMQAMSFVQKVAEIAEQLQHHPDIHIFYDRVRLVVWTHDVGDVTESDVEFMREVNDIAL